MIEFWIAFLGIAGTLSATALTSILNSRQAQQRANDERDLALMKARTDAITSFAASILSYLSMEQARWHRRYIPDNHETERSTDSVDAAVRDARRSARRDYYALLLILPETAPAASAERLLISIAKLREVKSASVLVGSADTIRSELSSFVSSCRASI